MRKKSIIPGGVNRLAAFLLCCTILIPAEISANAGDSDRFLWKSVPRAQCKLDDKTPLAWNVFQTERKKESHLLLILLGRRYIALDIKARVAYSVALPDLQAKGADFESGNLFVPSRVLPTDEWSLRDVGPAELIKLKLGDYGTHLQIELPHAPDLRGLY
jgi:hypothetical protein